MSGPLSEGVSGAVGPVNRHALSAVVRQGARQGVSLGLSRLLSVRCRDICRHNGVLVSAMSAPVVATCRASGMGLSDASRATWLRQVGMVWVVGATSRLECRDMSVSLLWLVRRLSVGCRNACRRE